MDMPGLQAHRHAETLGLPENILAVRLPDIELAKENPTIGPQGFHLVNVNGRAASIELYLGRTTLTLNGELRHVRWTSYNKSVRTYQGEVEANGEIQHDFLQALTKFPNSLDAQAAFPELVSVWKAIFCAVEQSAEAIENNSLSRSRFEA